MFHHIGSPNLCSFGWSLKGEFYETNNAMIINKNFLNICSKIPIMKIVFWQQSKDGHQLFLLSVICLVHWWISRLEGQHICTNKNNGCSSIIICPQSSEQDQTWKLHSSMSARHYQNMSLNSPLSDGQHQTASDIDLQLPLPSDSRKQHQIWTCIHLCLCPANIAASPFRISSCFNPPLIFN